MLTCLQGRVLVYDCSTARAVHVLDLHSPVHSLSCSLGSAHFAAGLASGTLALVDWTSGARTDLEGERHTSRLLYLIDSADCACIHVSMFQPD